MRDIAWQSDTHTTLIAAAIVMKTAGMKRIPVSPMSNVTIKTETLPNWAGHLPDQCRTDAECGE
jgi:hypothetical protein